MKLLSRPGTRGLAAAVLAAALVVTACGSDSGGGGGGGEAAAARGPITIWYSNNAQEIAWGKQVVDAWNTAHPDEKVTAQEIPAGKSSEEVIGAAITAGTEPCLIYNTSPAAVPGFQKQGGLINLSSFADGTSYIETRSGDARAAVQVAGRQLLPDAVEAEPGDDLLQQGR